MNLTTHLLADQELAARLEVAVSAARAAGALTLDWFCRPRLEVERKGDGSPVTAADRAAERLIRELVGQAFPDDQVLGEEFGETPSEGGNSSRYKWVLDPIDGTKSFITGVPLYTTLVAVLEDNHPRAGVIYAPATGELVYAAHQGGSWYVRGTSAPEPARVAQTDNLAEATFLTSETKSFGAPGSTPQRRVYEQLETACRLTRTWGDAYGYLLVAVGRADVMVDPIMNLWDAAALQPILEEAGGRFGDWTGRPTVHSGHSVAATQALFDQVVAITRGAAPNPCGA
jgi:histidinol phosphatase-like enzyme (inositol monophosphatase family)